MIKLRLLRQGYYPGLFETANTILQVFVKGKQESQSRDNVSTEKKGEKEKENMLLALKMEERAIN